MAQIGWIDFSPTHRDRVGSVLDLLGSSGVVDELGVGTLRDAIADTLFPGISTIQTRAKYFFIIPYILREYQDLKPQLRRDRSAALYLRTRENEIMWALAEKHGHKEGKGVIGISKKKPAELARRPSAIYWNGLHSYRFILTGGLALDPFLKARSGRSVESLLASTPESDDQGADDRDHDYENLFRIKVPRKRGWGKDLDLPLDPEEAGFFRDRIKELAGDCLIGHLAEDDRFWMICQAKDRFRDFSWAAMELPVKGDWKNQVRLAHDFSLLMHGAHIFYNGLLQTGKFGANPYQEDWEQWRKTLPTMMIDFQKFDMEELFRMATRKAEFVEAWWTQARKGFPDRKVLTELIRIQELQNKGPKARLNGQKFGDVVQDEWIGLDHLEYRYGNAKTILQDIREGLAA